jgi:type I restriction enzyme S subunit
MALRFKQDDGSDYPAWEEKKLGEIGLFFRGHSYPPNDVLTNRQGILILRSNNIQDGNLCLDDDLQFVSKECHIDPILKKNDVVICMFNGSKHLVGKSAYYKGNSIYKTTIGAFCSIFRSNNILAQYILHTPKYKECITFLLAGSSINFLKNSDLANLEFALPTSLEEQQKIAQVLSDMDDLIYKTEEIIEKQKKLRQGMMQKIFSQKFRFKQANGNPFPAWTNTDIKSISTHKSSNLSLDSLKNNYGVYNLYGATGLLKKIDFFTEKDDYLAIVKDGSGVGRIFYCEKDSSVLSTMSIIKANNQVHLKYLYYILSNVSFKSCTTGSSIPHIYYKDYSQLKIQLPSLPEQKKIAILLSSLDDQILKTEDELNLLKKLKKSLMQQLFS